jgi:hypothetical protein
MGRFNEKLAYPFEQHLPIFGPWASVVREDFGSVWLFLNCRSQEREKYVVISLNGAQQQDVPTKLTL